VKEKKGKTDYRSLFSEDRVERKKGEREAGGYASAIRRIGKKKKKAKAMFDAVPRGEEGRKKE